MGEATEIEARTALLATAERAASTLRLSIATKPPETPIETNVQSLGGLAGVIDALLGDIARCGGIDCMGRSVDGIKLWVTRDRFEAAERRAVRYEATLRAIAEAVSEDRGDLDMLVDWQGTAQALARAARTALVDAPAATDDAGGSRS